MSTRRSGIVARTVLMTTLVAAIAVIVAGVAAFPLVRATAEGLARSDLARLADLTVTALSRGPGGQFVLPPRLAGVLRAEDVDAYVVAAGASDLPAGLTDADVAAVTSGEPISVVGRTPDGTVLIEGRPLDRGVGIVLIQPTDVIGASASAVLMRMGLALALGLAIAVLVAVIAATRLTRPLRTAADAADRLGGGERGVVVRPEGPAEVARIAESLNRLSSALATSEGRQRDFLLSVSHELRTPLTAVKGYAEALADGVVPVDDVARTGGVLAGEAARLDRLVTDLLDLARLGADDFRITAVDVDVAGLVRDAGAVWADRSERVGITVTVEAPPEPLLARADPLRLRQVVDNLAENALRVTPSGGRIVISARPDATGSLIEVSVRDTGPGLSADDLVVAFEPGVLHDRYRGERQVGTGVGLALVGRLAARMGGEARAAAGPEGGASFTVTVPAAGPTVTP